MSSTGSRENTDLVIDDKVLFGMNTLVNELKIKDDEIEKKKETDLKSILREPKEQVEDYLSYLPNTSNMEFLSNNNENDNVSRRSRGWSKSSGKLNEERDFPIGLVNDMLGDKQAAKSIIPESILYNNNNAPLDDEYNINPTVEQHKTVERSPEDELNEKIKLINQYEQLTKKIKDREIKQFSIHSNADEIRLEIQKIKHSKKREASTKIMRVCTTTIAKGIEQFFNINPIFSIDLNGFTAHLRHNISDFDDIFDELYDKYSSSGKSQPPEVRFIITFLTTLVGFIMANSAPKALFNYISQNSGTDNVAPTYGHMPAPDASDPAVEEIIMNMQQRLEKKQN